MYLVKIYDGIEDTKGTVIHSPYIDDIKLSSGVLTEVVDGIDDFTFSFNLKNPAWGRVRPLQTLIKVVDVKKNKTLFNGRVLKPKGSMSNEGHFSRAFECESILAYLHDSAQRHAEIRDTTIREFFEILIDNHNSQVEPHKRFRAGNVTVSNPTDNVYRYLRYEDTFEEIKDNLLDRLGGFLVLREEADGNYLDYLTEVGENVDSTPIRLAHNLKGMSYEIDPTEVITRLVPLGERIESEDEDAADASQARLTIAEVNNGIDYLDDLELQAEFGIIEKSVTWDDVTTPQRLMTNGLNFLRDQKAASVSYDVSSTNLQLIGLDIDSFEVGNRHPLINPVFAVNERIQIIEKRTDILKPENSSLKIGDKHRTLSQYQTDLRKSQRDVVDLQSTVNRQAQRISSLQTELTTVDDAVKSIEDALGEADLPALEQAIQDLQDAITALNEAIDNIPIYEPATPTEDGLMSSADKVKLDRITVLNDVDLDALKTKLDLITVVNPVDLDDLVSRVTALENGGGNDG